MSDTASDEKNALEIIDECINILGASEIPSQEDIMNDGKTPNSCSYNGIQCDDFKHYTEVYTQNLNNLYKTIDSSAAILGNEKEKTDFFTPKISALIAYKFRIQYINQIEIPTKDDINALDRDINNHSANQGCLTQLKKMQFAREMCDIQLHYLDEVELLFSYYRMVFLDNIKAKPNYFLSDKRNATKIQQTNKSEYASNQTHVISRNKLPQITDEQRDNIKRCLDKGVKNKWLNNDIQTGCYSWEKSHIKSKYLCENQIYGDSDLLRLTAMLIIKLSNKFYTLIATRTKKPRIRWEFYNDFFKPNLILKVKNIVYKDKLSIESNLEEYCEKWKFKAIALEEIDFIAT
jgi:hypothetical protein